MNGKPAPGPEQNPLWKPTPQQLRSLVLSYLTHNCYVEAAKAFARDSAVKHLDADGDEIMGPPGSESEDGELDEETLRLVELRRDIRINILSGRIDEATELLNTHFPTVLNADAPATYSKAPPTSSSNSRFPQPDFTFPNSLEPDHLALNLCIQSFIETSRTRPLPYPPPSSTAPRASMNGTSSFTTSSIRNLPTSAEPTPQQKQMLILAQELYARASELPRPDDRAIYLKELENVAAVMAYREPETSPVKRYLTQERREAVADQINSAVLYRTRRPPQSCLEGYAKHTTVVWEALHDLQVKLPAKPPPGVMPPPPPSGSGNPPGKGTKDIAPPFDLNRFLESYSSEKTA